MNYRILWFLLFLSSFTFAQEWPFGQNNSLPAGAGEPPNDPPVWNSTPAPVCTAGIASSYDLDPHFSDPEGDTVAVTNEPGCVLPTGVTINDATDKVDCATTTTAGTTTGCVFGLNDGTNPTVNSDALSIVVNAIPALGTIYERDYAGAARLGTSGGDEV